MEPEDVEKHLKLRIEQSREWFQQGLPDPILGLQMRGFPCNAQPLEFIDDPSRVERYGVKFRLEWIGSSKDTCECLIEIRIRPTWYVKKDGSKDRPYIITRVVDPETKKAVDPGCHIPYVQENYVEQTSQFSIRDWYHRWLGWKVLREDATVASIMGSKRPVSSS